MSEAGDSNPLWQWSATALAGAYRAGNVTPVEAVLSCLARIQQVNPQINAFVALREAVLDDAQASTERFRAGLPLSALDGLPLSIKDNLCTADMPTTWGCPSLRAHPPVARDELPVARARAAGALIVGKTNVPEFTLEGYTDNPLFGVTRNPWDLTLTPGGSSGGAVASVAAGCTPLALGTDGGGSIRRPASHCGLVGFKPSIGAIARGDGLPSLLLDFEVVGPMARRVADARLMFEVLRGPRSADRASLACHAARRPHQHPTRPARVLYVPTLSQAPVDPAILAACAVAANRLRDLGCEVETGELPLPIEALSRQWPTVGQIGLAAMFKATPSWRERASPKYRAMAAQGEAVGAAALWQLLEAVEQLRRDCAHLFETFDLIAMPSAAALPWPAQEPFPSVIAGQDVGPRGHAVFTGWVNAAGLPAVSVPTAPSVSGLPIGLQLIGPYGADDEVLNVAEAFERLCPWNQRRPPL
ncbi:amidase [Hydrogenophaga sp.]|uniref:amidase n=1 Tax=Hydrogenophaga sp. TaxID=1904254 RepID=UPI002FC64B59